MKATAEYGTSYAVGVDRGGTKIRMALVNSHGEVLEFEQETMPVQTLAALREVGNQLVPMLEAFLNRPYVRKYSPVGVGVSSVGVMNQRGEIMDSCFKYEQDHYPIPIQKVLQEGLRQRYPVLVEGDAKSAVYGEYRFGAGRGVRNMIGLTIGTGVGGGLILDGKLYHGKDGYAGMLGFLSVDMYGHDCASGVRGCLDSYGCGTAIRKQAQLALERGELSRLKELSQGNPSLVSSEMVFLAAAEGDRLAKELIDEAAYALGIGIASLIHALNPELVVLGGGLAEQGKLFLDPVRETVQQHLMGSFAQTPIREAELGNLAGMIGAVALLMEKLKV
ncbi:MAG: ROK family protein [Anaerolineales bacterium]|nr:ROK family protein [Anaerolineales bacterium]